MSTRVSINGKIYKPEEAFISVFDRAVLYGDGVYETLRTYQGKMFLYQEHLKRLQLSMAALGIHFNLTSEQVADEIYRTLDAAGNPESMIRLMVSRGTSMISLNPYECKEPTRIIIVEEYKPFPQKYYEEGADLIIAETRRNYPKSLSPSIKSLNLLNNFLAYKEAVDKKAFDAVLLSVEGFVTEGTTFNVFWVKDGVIYTADESVGILYGVTRELVFKLADKNNIIWTKGLYKADALLQADECFITSTLKEVMPIRKINGTIIGKKCPGPLTALLMKLLGELVAG